MPTSAPAQIEPPRRTPHVAVVGAGVTGAACGLEVARRSRPQGSQLRVSLHERAPQVGGRLSRSPFAGVDDIDESADAFLARVPDAVELAHEVGLGDQLVHPEAVGAAVWHDGLHDIPAGLVLGVPGNPLALARTGLLSWPAKLRAALEPALPRSSTDHDSLGRFMRARFGDQVHERLVDALIGSIYATDTDRFSLREVPQVAALAEHRSLLLAARRAARRAPGTASAAGAAIFAAPRAGMGSLVEATCGRFVEAGGELQTGNRPTIERDGTRWRVDDEPADAVVLALPPSEVAGYVDASWTDVDAAGLEAELLGAPTSDVIMVTLHIDANEWPDRLTGRSGYLVPKPVQRFVTAASFGSQKWAHWRPPGGGEVLRVSLGRAGMPVMHLGDDEVVERVLDDLGLHLRVTFTPRQIRITRWQGAFATYLPHHRSWVERIRESLPSGLFVAGAGFDGMGIPACVRSGRTIAERVAEHVAILAT